MSDFRKYERHECGSDGYPLQWHRGANGSGKDGPGLKQMVREMAGHRCERCKHPYECGKHGNGEWSPCDHACCHEADEGHLASTATVMHGQAKWRILTVHHLDENKANCELWNLAALCQKCHLHIQNKVKMDQLFFAELLDVSPWFKPHLEGYRAALREKKVLA